MRESHQRAFEELETATEELRSINEELQSTNEELETAKEERDLEYDNLVADCREVLKTLVSQESEVGTKDGGAFLMRIMPYRTTENVIDGLVITFVNIQRLKEANSKSES